MPTLIAPAADPTAASAETRAPHQANGTISSSAGAAMENIPSVSARPQTLDAPSLRISSVVQADTLGVSAATLASRPVSNVALNGATPLRTHPPARLFAPRVQLPEQFPVAARASAPLAIPQATASGPSVIYSNSAYCACVALGAMALALSGHSRPLQSLGVGLNLLSGAMALHLLANATARQCVLSAVAAERPVSVANLNPLASLDLTTATTIGAQALFGLALTASHANAVTGPLTSAALLALAVSWLYKTEAGQALVGQTAKAVGPNLQRGTTGLLSILSAGAGGALLSNEHVSLSANMAIENGFVSAGGAMRWSGALSNTVATALAPARHGRVAALQHRRESFIRSGLQALAAATCSAGVHDVRVDAEHIARFAFGLPDPSACRGDAALVDLIRVLPTLCEDHNGLRALIFAALDQQIHITLPSLSFRSPRPQAAANGRSAILFGMTTKITQGVVSIGEFHAPEVAISSAGAVARFGAFLGMAFVKFYRGVTAVLLALVRLAFWPIADAHKPSFLHESAQQVRQAKISVGPVLYLPWDSKLFAKGIDLSWFVHYQFQGLGQDASSIPLGEENRIAPGISVDRQGQLRGRVGLRVLGMQVHGFDLGKIRLPGRPEESFLQAAQHVNDTTSDVHFTGSPNLEGANGQLYKMQLPNKPLRIAIETTEYASLSADGMVQSGTKATVSFALPEPITLSAFQPSPGQSSAALSFDAQLKCHAAANLSTFTLFEAGLQAASAIHVYPTMPETRAPRTPLVTYVAETFADVDDQKGDLWFQLRSTASDSDHRKLGDLLQGTKEASMLWLHGISGWLSFDPRRVRPRF